MWDPALERPAGTLGRSHLSTPTPRCGCHGKDSDSPLHRTSSPKPWCRLPAAGAWESPEEAHPPGQVGPLQALHKGQCGLTGSGILGTWPGHSLNSPAALGAGTHGGPPSGSGKRPCHVPRLPGTPHLAGAVCLKPRGAVAGVRQASQVTGSCDRPPTGAELSHRLGHLTGDSRGQVAGARAVGTLATPALHFPSASHRGGRTGRTWVHDGPDPQAW